MQYATPFRRREFSTWLCHRTYFFANGKASWRNHSYAQVMYVGLVVGCLPPCLHSSTRRRFYWLINWDRDRMMHQCDCICAFIARCVQMDYCSKLIESICRGSDRQREWLNVCQCNRYTPFEHFILYINSVYPFSLSYLLPMRMQMPGCPYK